MERDFCYPARYFLLSIALLAFSIRLLFFYFFLHDNPCQLLFDSKHYHDLAAALASGNGMLNGDGVIQFYRVPGYSFFLAILYFLVGQKPLVALLAQIVVASVMPIQLYFLSLTFFPSSPDFAKVSSLVACFHLPFVLFSGLVFSETLFLCFFMFFLQSFFMLLKKTHLSYRYSFGAGIALGVASLMRPIGHYILPLVLVSLLFFPTKWLTGIQRTGLFFIGWLSIVGWWLLRNYLLTGFVFFHTLPGPHFLNHVAVHLQMNRDGSSFQSAQKKVYEQYAAQCDELELRKGSPLSEIERCYAAESLTRNIMHKVGVIRLGIFSLLNMIKTCCSLYMAELLFIDSKGQLPECSANRSLKSIVMRFLCPTVSHWWLRILIYYEIMVHFLLLLGCVLYGFVVVLKGTMRAKILFLVAIVLIALIVFLSAACGYARLRFPVEPLGLLLGLYFWYAWYKKQPQVNFCGE